MSIIGLGSGVTAGAALVHPVAAVDVIEISPEVVEASRYFAAENRHALDDPRTRLIVGDGRSHMALSLTPIRRDRLRAVQSLDGRSGGPLHPRVLHHSSQIGCRRAGSSVSGRTRTTSARRISAPSWRRSCPSSRMARMWLVGNGDLLMVGSAGPLGSALERHRKLVAASGRRRQIFSRWPSRRPSRSGRCLPGAETNCGRMRGMRPCSWTIGWRSNSPAPAR